MRREIIGANRRKYQRQSAYTQMQITWKGQSCFQIVVQKAKNSQVTMVVDPYGEEIGLKPSFQPADIVLVTHNHGDHNNIKSVPGNPFAISGPGEYEIKEVYVEGISAWHDNAQGKERGDNTIYIIKAEDLKLCHLGDLGQKELTDEQLDKIGQVDVLMIPVGGNFTISAKEAMGIMSQIEPKITIPMHYQIPKLKVKLDDVDKFLKSLGVKSLTPESKLTVKKKDILPEEAKIVILKP
jgi:L-ascorbate metabolism protein UlaG (beta-lactamase superfamily)